MRLLVWLKEMRNGLIESFHNFAPDRGVKDLRQARKRSLLPSVGRGQITLESQQRDRYSGGEADQT